LTKSTCVFSNFGCTVNILKYYGGHMQAHLFMTEACKGTKALFEEWNDEFRVALSHYKRKLDMMSFSQFFKDFLLDHSRYLYLKLEIIVDFGSGLLALLEFLEQVEDISKLNFSVLWIKAEVIRENEEEFLLLHDFIAQHPQRMNAKIRHFKDEFQKTVKKLGEKITCLPLFNFGHHDDEEVYQRKYLINHARIDHYLDDLQLFENNNFQIDNLKMYLNPKYLPKFKLSESITNSVKDFDIKFYNGIVDRSDEDNILSLLSYCQESWPNSSISVGNVLKSIYLLHNLPWGVTYTPFNMEQNYFTNSHIFYKYKKAYWKLSFKKMLMSQLKSEGLELILEGNLIVFDFERKNFVIDGLEDIERIIIPSEEIDIQIKEYLDVWASNVIMKKENLTGGFKLNSISNLEFVQTLNISHSSSISITIENLEECSQFYSLIQENELYKYTNFEVVF